MRDGGSGWASQRLSIRLRGGMGRLTAMQGSLGRPRSGHGPWVIRPGVRSGHDCAPENTGRRAHSMVEECACTWDRADAMQAEPGQRPRPHGTAAARLKNGCRWDRADAQRAQATGKDAATLQCQSRVFMHLTARDSALPLIPSRRGGETLIPGDNSAPRSTGWRTHHRKRECSSPLDPRGRPSTGERRMPTALLPGLPSSSPAPIPPETP
jgi:hypothetical protein